MWKDLEGTFDRQLLAFWSSSPLFSLQSGELRKLSPACVTMSLHCCSSIYLLGFQASLMKHICGQFNYCLSHLYSLVHFERAFISMHNLIW